MCVGVCVRDGKGKEMEEQRMTRGRKNRMVPLMEMRCDSSPWDCVINWVQVTSSMSGQ